MAEETQAVEKMSEEECKALYELVCKKDLTDEEKTKIKTTIEANPQVLGQIEFTKNLKLTDFVTEYKKPEDLPHLLEQHAKDVEVLDTVLTNLKDCQVVHNGKDKTAAQYLLDTPVLENGELLGTELAKNIHFLGTTKRDKGVPVEMHAAVDNGFAQNETFYKSLYSADGYAANRNARNLSGQKVERLMLECIAARDGTAKANDFAKELAESAGSAYVEKVQNDKIEDNTVEDVKKRAFMAHPDKGRESMTVEKSLESMTAEELEDFSRRNVMNVETAQKVKKLMDDKKKEANMAKTPAAPHHHEKKEHNEKFKDQDVIEYMYNEWFLAGLSWLFDKGEDLLDAVVDKLVDNSVEKSARRAREAHAAKDALAKEVVARVQRFEDVADERIDQVKKEKAIRNAHFADDIVAPLMEIDFTKLDSAKEDELKRKYSAYLIDGLKEQAKNKGQGAVTEFLEKCPQRYKNMFDEADTMKVLAAKQVKLEMIDEVMWSTGAWRKKLKDLNVSSADEWKKIFKKEFATDEKLLARYEKRRAKREEELIEAAASVRADAAILAEAKWSEIDPTDTKKQQKFINENILSKYNVEIAEATTAEAKQAAIERRAQFEANYAKLSPALRTQYVTQTMADMEVKTFLKEQMDLTDEARQAQNQDRKDCRYDANGAYPHKDCADALKRARNRADSVSKSLIDVKGLSEEYKGDVEVQKSLYEAAFETDREKLLGKVSDVAMRDVGKLEARRLANKERKETLATFLKNLEIKKAVSRISPLLMGQQVQDR